MSYKLGDVLAAALLGNAIDITFTKMGYYDGQDWSAVRKSAIG
jgi:hypothetical protein